MYLLKGVLCILELDAKENSLTQLIFLIACRNILSRRLLFAINGRSGLPLPTITISKMAKMPFIPDPRYSNSTDRQYKAHQQIKEDEHDTPSPTHRKLIYLGIRCLSEYKVASNSKSKYLEGYPFERVRR
jgi:hypothetical protein